MATLIDLVLDDARERLTARVAEQGLRLSGDGRVTTELRHEAAYSYLDVKLEGIAVPPTPGEPEFFQQWRGCATYRVVDSRVGITGYEFISIKGY